MTASVPSSMEVVATACAIGAGVGYGWAWWRGREKTSRFISPRRVWFFLSGLAISWIAMASRLAVLDHQLLTFHMVNHLLLSNVSAPLILLGEPLLVFRQGLQDWGYFGSFFRSPRLEDLVRAIAHPVFCWTASITTLAVWHIPGVFAAAMHSTFLHGFEAVSFLVAGLLFWSPIVEPWPVRHMRPRWWAPIYLLLATFPCDALSGFLAFCDRVVYSSYLVMPRHFALSALQDQECAAALMWTFVTILYLVPGVALTVNEVTRTGEQTASAQLVTIKKKGA